MDMTLTHTTKYQRVVSLLAAVTLVFVFWVTCCGQVAIAGTADLAATGQPSTVKDPYMAQENMQNSNWQKSVEQIFGVAKPFDPKRTVEQLSNCRQWAVPDAPDPASYEWYRAATTLNAIKFRSALEHQQMLILYEAAARRGHYTAVKQLTIHYSTGALTSDGRFLPEPDKARYWINYGLLKEWPGALEWLATALQKGSAGFPRNAELSMTYMQQASDLGVALAQWQLALHYGNRLKQVDKEKALLRCAAAQGLHAGLYDWAGYNKINGNAKEALMLYQQAVMAGGDAGGRAAFTLSDAFGGRTYNQRDLKTFSDAARKAAYLEINEALVGGAQSDGNIFLRFPRLNEVLPLPPAKIPPWKGIYSAMSPDDAKYYRNPPSPQTYINDISRSGGYLISDDYLSKPTLGAD